MVCLEVLSPPFLTVYGFHLVEVLEYERGQMPADDKSTMRHILIMYPGMIALEKEGKDVRKWIKEHKRTLPRANSVPRQQVAKPRARPARVSCPAVAASAARPCVVLNTWYYVTTTLTLSLPHPSGAAAASRKICQITNTKPKGASSWCHARASDSTSARPAATAILPALPSLATFSRVRVYALNIAITAPHLSPLPPTPPFALHLNHDPSNDG